LSSLSLLLFRSLLPLLLLGRLLLLLPLLMDLSSLLSRFVLCFSIFVLAVAIVAVVGHAPIPT
jgi:hypothetical protein